MHTHCRNSCQAPRPIETGRLSFENVDDWSAPFPPALLNWRCHGPSEVCQWSGDRAWASFVQTMAPGRMQVKEPDLSGGGAHSPGERDKGIDHDTAGIWRNGCVEGIEQSIRSFVRRVREEVDTDLPRPPREFPSCGECLRIPPPDPWDPESGFRQVYPLSVRSGGTRESHLPS
jgi:hypothetical protein